MWDLIRMAVGGAQGVPDVWKEHLPQSTKHINSETLPSHLSPMTCLPRQGSLCNPRRDKEKDRRIRTQEFSITAEGAIVDGPRAKYASLPRNFRSRW